jgi:putative PIN family toxin of toxin-antitoxin system
MNAVLDTNVVVSATLIRGSNEHQSLRAWERGTFDLVVSPEILQELGRALFYEKLRKYRWMSEPQVRELLELLAQASILVPGRARLRVSRDQDDDKFLVAAVEAGAQYVVTGDRDLLDLERYRDVRIVKPRAFLVIVRNAGRRRH